MPLLHSSTSKPKWSVNYSEFIINLIENPWKYIVFVLIKLLKFKIYLSL